MHELIQLVCCTQCGKYDLPRTRFCANCEGEEFTLASPKGSGRLSSWTVIRKPSTAYEALGIYAVGLVELVEGVRLIGRLDRFVPPPDIGAEVRIVDWVDNVPIFSVESG